MTHGKWKVTAKHSENWQKCFPVNDRQKVSTFRPGIWYEKSESKFVNISAKACQNLIFFYGVKIGLRDIDAWNKPEFKIFILQSLKDVFVCV